jgi:NADH:ubiquinone oxidoreductase subunit 6 (subunit J)
MAIFWFLAATCIASALRVVTAKTQSDWLAACLVFSIAVAVLFALLRNYWAVGFCLPIIVGVGWSRKELANQSEPTSGQKMEETIAEPLLVSTASVALAWLLAVSIHWTVTEEASPDRIRKTQRALPRVALANETTVEETDTPIAASTTNEGWLITISVLFMGLSCQLALSAEIKHERQGSNT